MADQVLQSFLMKLGFQLDTAGMSRLETFAKSSATWAKQIAESVIQLGKKLEESTKKTAEHEEQQKKTREGWRLSKEAVLELVGALVSLAAIGEEAARRVSAHFEKMFYLSQQVGTTGRALETLRFQFQYIGLTVGQADVAVGGLADKMLMMPGLANSISSVIGKQVTDAGDAITKMGVRYGEILKQYGPGSPQEIQLRAYAQGLGIDPNTIARIGRNSDAFLEAQEKINAALKKMGFGEGKEALENAERLSVKFQQSWLTFTTTINLAWEQFGLALMPGIMKIVNAVTDWLGISNKSAKELCETFSNFVDGLIGPNGEKLKAWLDTAWKTIKAIGDQLLSINWGAVASALASLVFLVLKLVEAFGWLADKIGGIPAILVTVAGFYIGKMVLMKAATWAIAAAWGGVGEAAAAAAASSALAASAIVGSIGASVFALYQLITQGTGQKGSWTDPNSSTKFLDPSLQFGQGTDAPGYVPDQPAISGSQADYDKWGSGWRRRDSTPEEHNRVAGSTGRTGEAAGGGGYGSFDKLLSAFSAWWAGSAGYMPIVQLADSFYTKFYDLMSRILQEFGFKQAEGGAGVGGGGGGAPSGTGGGAAPSTSDQPAPSGDQPAPGTAPGATPGNAPGANTYAGRSNALLADLKKNFGLTDTQAAGLIGNLGFESGGLTPGMQEKGVHGANRGGLGYAQWTASRRVAFENWAKEHNLSTNSEEANRGFLIHELQTTHKGTIDALKKTNTLEQATWTAGQTFERPGGTTASNLPGYQRRLAYAQQSAEAAKNFGGPTPPGGQGDMPGAPATADAGGDPHNKMSGLVDQALTMQGMDINNPTLRHFVKNGAGIDPKYVAWCAAFVNSMIGTVGGKKGSNIASDMMKWGHEVGLDQMMKGDVGVALHGAVGSLGSHAVFMTGLKKLDAMGRMLVQTVGREGDVLKTRWRHASEMHFRRADDPSLTARLGTDRRSTSPQHQAEASGGSVGGKTEVTVNAYGAADPHGTARSLYDLASRHAPMLQRNSKTAMA